MRSSVLFVGLILFAALIYAQQGEDVKEVIEKQMAAAPAPASGGGAAPMPAKEVRPEKIVNVKAGPGPRFGPDFELPPEAIEGFIFREIGDALMQKYGEENLLSKCGNQRELVDLALGEFQESGLNLQEEFCSGMEESIKNCEENKKQCERIGGDGGPRFGPPDEEGEQYVATCPPDAKKLVEICVKRMTREFERQFKDREEDIDIDCNLRWEFEQGHFQEQCEGGQLRLPEFCSKEKFIKECLQRMPSDFGQQPMEQQPPQPQTPQQAQPWQGQRCPPKPQLPQEWFDACNSGGGRVESITDQQGCVTRIDCVYGQQQPAPTITTCPSEESKERYKQDCIRKEGRVEDRKDAQGCHYYECIFPAQPAQPSPQQPPSTCPSESEKEGVRAECRSRGCNPVDQQDQKGCWFVNCQCPPPQQPTAQPTQTPQPTPAPGSNMSYASTIYFASNPAPYSGFFSARTPQEACEQEWQRNEPRFQKDCERQKQQGPKFNPCNQESFVASCRQERLGQMAKERGRLNYDRICELETKRQLRDMERYCKDTTKGKEQCLKETERGCEFGRKQIERCKELTSPERVKEAIAKGVEKKCRQEKHRKRIDIKPINIEELPRSEIIPAVIAVRDNISLDEVRQLEQAVQRVEGYNTISGLRIYSVLVKADDFGKLKQLPFITDAKVDPIRQSLGVLEKKEGRLSELDRTVTALEATQEFLPSTEGSLVGFEAENVAQAKQKVEEVFKDKGIGYAIQQILGMKAEQEKNEADELKAESERLTKTTERLKKLVEQVDDVSLQAVLLEQIKELEAQQKSIQDKADNKKRGAAGLFSLFGLFG